MLKIITVSILLTLVPLAYPLQGIDTAQLLPTATYQCIKSNGNLFAIVRGSLGNGNVDPNAIQGLYNAAAAGMLTDVKMIPCRGKSAVSQAEQFMNRVHNDLFNTVWIEVMRNLNPGCMWTSDAVSNCQFIAEIAKIIGSKDKHIGIFSDIESWKQIFNDQKACPELNKYQIWYSHDDKADDFSDFPDFGGWDFPRLKQFDKNFSICGVKVNRNYHPSA